MSCYQWEASYFFSFFYHYFGQLQPFLSHFAVNSSHFAANLGYIRYSLSTKNLFGNHFTPFFGHFALNFVILWQLCTNFAANLGAKNKQKRSILIRIPRHSSHLGKHSAAKKGDQSLSLKKCLASPTEARTHNQTGQVFTWSQVLYGLGYQGVA